MTAALTCGRLPSCPGILPLASDEIGVGQVFVIAGCPGEAVEVVDVVFAGAGSEAVFAGAGGRQFSLMLVGRQFSLVMAVYWSFFCGVVR